MAMWGKMWGKYGEKKIVGEQTVFPTMFNVSAPNRAAFLQGLANVFRRDGGELW